MRIVLDDALYFGCSYIEKGPSRASPDSKIKYGGRYLGTFASDPPLMCLLFTFHHGGSPNLVVQLQNWLCALSKCFSAKSSRIEFYFQKRLQ